MLSNIISDNKIFTIQYSYIHSYTVSKFNKLVCSATKSANNVIIYVHVRMYINNCQSE